MASLTTEASRNVFSKWLTGNDESDAKALQRAFRGARLSITVWRQVVAECKAVRL
jgi:hypothetical protein